MVSERRAITGSADRDRGAGAFLASSVTAGARPVTLVDPAARTENDEQDFIDEVAERVIQKLRDFRPDSCEKSNSECRGLVFVVCSFEPDMDPVFDAIAAAASAVGLRAERVKDVQGDYRITEKILTLVQGAELIVADLSRERPNVYFELGYARGLGKTVITILRAGTTAHLDVRDWTYLEYIDSRPLEHQLRERFLFELQSVASGPD